MRKILLKIVDNSKTPYIVTIFIIGCLLIPFYWMLVTSFKSLEEIFTLPPSYFPNHFTVRAYYDLITNPWGRPDSPLAYMRNSLIISLTATSIAAIGSIFTAYGLSHFPFRGSEQLGWTFLFIRTIPPLTLLLPLYIIFKELALIDTLWSVVIFNLMLIYPLLTWLLKLFFDAFPRDLIDSAMVDGCTRTGTLFRVVLPVSLPAIAAITSIGFLWAWNEFVAPLLYIHSPPLFPLTVGVYDFRGDEFTYWNHVSGLGILACIPSLTFFILAQKYIIKGLTAGALKY